MRPASEVSVDDDDDDDSKGEMEEIDIESGVLQRGTCGTNEISHSVARTEDLTEHTSDNSHNAPTAVAESRACRICHLGLESGVLIQLGCSCTADLASAHKNCAESWFKTKGNRTCEICDSVARNVRIVGIPATSTVSITAPSSEIPTLWRSHYCFNVLLSFVLFALFIICVFLFHVPSS